MSTKITGTVGRINSKPYNGKMLYSLKLNEIDTWYGLGQGDPKLSEGSKVEFESKTNSKGYSDIIWATLRVLQAPVQDVSTGSSVALVASSGHTNGFLSKDSYWNRKEERDAKQDLLRELGATRNTAIEWIKLLLANEALKLPTKIADKEGFLQKLLADYVDKFRGISTEKDSELPAGSPNGSDAVMVAEQDNWN